MNTTEIVPVANLAQSKYGTDDVFNEMASSSDFLPRLQLFGSNSEYVKRGLIKMAHYGLVVRKEQVEDLGDQVDVIPLSWRPKAMVMKKDGSPPLSYFDTNSTEFVDVQKKANSGEKDTGCSYGPEFLLYIPVAKRFVTYFMNTKTSRNQARELNNLKGKVATLKVKYIKNQSYSWHGPEILTSSATFDSPPSDEMNRQLHKFNNPEPFVQDSDTEELENGDRVR